MDAKEKQERRRQKKECRKAKRKAMKHAKGLSALFGVISFVCVVLLIVTTLFDQTFHVLFGTHYAELKNTSEEAEYFSSDFASDEERRDYGLEIVRQLEEEGAVLLKNENNCLPLAKESRVSCFSQSSVRLVYGGTGSGSVDTSTAVTLKEALEEEGFCVNDTLWNFYEEGDGKDYVRGTRSIRGGGSWDINEVPWDIYTDEVLESVTAYGDAAIVVLGRSGGEGTDLPIDTCSDGRDGNYLALNQDEMDMLENLARMKQNGTISKIIILLNSSNAMEVDFLFEEAYGIDAALGIGDVGQNGIEGVAAILSGEVNPSGRLADTYCKDNLTSPAMQNFGAFTFTNADEVEVNGEKGMSDYYVVYQEGIYVGYRYYETRYEDYVMETGNAGTYAYASDVAYPFGYGLSYTEFSQELIQSRYDEQNDSFILDVVVTNTGKMAGKKVVEVYYQSPYTAYDIENQIEQASVNLCGFAKTKELAPGESETVQIVVEKRELACYDAYGYGTYILEEGNHYLTIGENAHDAVNNILAAKGYSPETTANRMDADGNATQVFVYHQDNTDNRTYASSANGTEIVNRFDNADLNRYDNGTQKLVYLSRSDWENTFPKSYVKLVITELMQKDLADCVYLDSGLSVGGEETMPVMGDTNGLSVVDLKGKSFDDPMWDELLDQMTYEEMADLVGNAFHLTKAVESVNLPDTRDENGPQGLTARLMKENVDSTSFTSEDVMAATWNLELIAQVGEIIGEDCLANGYAGLYGPGNNIHRTPYSGRNFEYYSEDGFLSGKMSAAEVAAIQSNGIYVFMKHAALNDGETERAGLSTFSNEQAIRQIYLKAFQYSMENNEIAGVMTSMNRIGCTWGSAHKGMLTEVMRNEWGNKGMYISDNTTTHTYTSGIDGVLAGNTLFDAMMGKQYSQYVKEGNGDATVANALRNACHYNLYVFANSSAMNGLTSETVVVKTTPVWEIALWVVTIVFIGLFIWQFSMMIVRGRRFKKEYYENCNSSALP